MISKFGSKNMLLWKRGSFVFTDENLWIASRPIWFDGTRHPEKFMNTPTKKILRSINSRKQFVESMPIFPNIVYKCLFTFKGGYAIEICIGVDLGLLIQI